MAYRVAICDDEGDFVALLREQVAEVLSDSGVEFQIGVFASGEALLTHISETAATFDLFLLDIFMKEVSGIDTAKAIRRTNDSAAIIFTTASDRYVFSGYEVQALQYLLKPIDRQALSTALLVDLKRRFENWCFVFRSEGMTQRVPYDDIEYLESALKSIKLVTRHETHRVYGKISDVERTLPGMYFCRCHRGFIVNLKQVSKMNAQSLTTLSGTVIPIGKTYAKATSHAFLNYIGGTER